MVARESAEDGEADRSGGERVNDVVQTYSGSQFSESLWHSHHARPALERAAAEGECVLVRLPNGGVRVLGPWEWPTRESEEERIIWP